eukprot:UN2657
MRLVDMMKESLESTRNEPLAVRRQTFRELMRQLHPDKNLDREVEAKSAFQELMQLKAGYLCTRTSA